ncbi:hypothetical protein [Streptomyces sp. NPDC058701]|uniref:hypothetical protein n=1 Tax=Streptomyces sp. NPDC058701 TaxID=3346608 RepID=UPI0036694AFC
MAQKTKCASEVWMTPPGGQARTARDVFDILFSRQVLDQSSKVSIKQEELAEVLRISQPKVSRAEAELRAKASSETAAEDASRSTLSSASSRTPRP